MTDVSLTLYGRLRDQLRASILEGRHLPGDKLPSESELAALHGVSRITVRQALGDLQREGLIVRHQGKGAFVSQPQHTSQRLNRLQGLGEALAGQGQTVHSQRMMMKRQKASARLAQLLNLAPGADVHQMVMLRYVNREPISVNCSFFPGSLGERVARLDLSGRDLIDVLEKDLNRVVARAELEISAVAMPAREARWLRVEEAAPAMCVQRTLFDADDLPIQTESVTYRAEAFSYRLSLTR